MPSVNNYNFSEIKFALLFEHTTEHICLEKIKTFNERMEHSQ